MISGGLHDPEPDRHQIVPPARIKAAQREWLFWAVMVFGLWAAFQGMAIIAFWFMVVVLIVVSVKVIAKPLANEIRKTWRS